LKGLDLNSYPELPGVYIMKSKEGKVLYVGKAKNIRQRLRYYIQEGLDPRKARLVAETDNVSFIVTQNELEALVLEANLIKQYKPRYNVVLRDDKNYPYIKIVMNEKYPHIEIARRIKHDGSLYFGPYVPAGIMWEALSFIRRHFNIRPCRYRLDKPMKPCIQYQMGRCPGPCAGLVTEEEYKKALQEVIMFLKGQRKELLEGLEEKMYKYAEEMRFEEAAKIRDRIKTLNMLWESQRVQSSIIEDVDVIGFYNSPFPPLTLRGGIEGGVTNAGVFVVLFLRNGLITGKKEFMIKRGDLLDIDQLPLIFEEFIEVFYSKEIIPPKILLLPVEPNEKDMLERWLSERRAVTFATEGEKVVIKRPETEEEHELLRLAEENARVFFDQETLKVEQIMRALSDMLDMDRIPESIGAFDISTTFGKDSTGGFVWWQDGNFLKDRYRHVRIQYQEGLNDYAMLEESIKRVIDSLSGELPDILIVDGGPGQLEVLKRAVEAKEEIIKKRPFLIALAKSPDRVFFNGREILLEGLPGIQDRAGLLLRSIRDEVHRFAIMYHRKLRDRRLTESRLEKIPGIGPKRRLELLRAFGSLDAIRRASPEEIARKVPGIGLKMAETIIERLNIKEDSYSND
jgi:excinuclease ABC subunit C